MSGIARVLAVATIATTLAACAPRRVDIAPAVVAATSPATFAGAWTLVAIDGRETLPVPLTVEEEALWWGARCSLNRLAYTRNGTMVAMAPIARGPNEAPPCLIGPGSDEKALDAFLPNVDSIEVGPANALKLYGGGHVMLFERRD